MAEGVDRIAQALLLVEQYGGIDGGHHKQWLIDRMLRCLLADQYEEWVRAYDEDAGEEYNHWDVGIAP